MCGRQLTRAAAFGNEHSRFFTQSIAREDFATNGAVTGFLSIVTVCKAVTLRPVPHMQME